MVDRGAGNSGATTRGLSDSSASLPRVPDASCSVLLLIALQLAFPVMILYKAES